MIAVIGSSKYQKELSEALIGMNVIFENYGDLTKVGLEMCIKKVRNMEEIDLLILDSTVTGHVDEMLTAVKNYRLVREDERIIMLIPEDMSLAESFAEYQVYDFVLLSN